MKSNPTSSDQLHTVDEAAVSEIIGKVLPPSDLGALSDSQIDSLLNQSDAMPVNVEALVGTVSNPGKGALPSGRDVVQVANLWHAMGKWAALVVAIVIVVMLVRQSGDSLQSEQFAGSDLSEWQVDFPPPVFVGTPLETVPGLTDPFGNPIPVSPPQLSLRLPEDARSNVALGKRVNSSTALPLEGELNAITDGIRGSDATVTLESGMQWVQVDLATPHEIYGIVVWHDYSMQTVVSDVIVAISNDPEFQEGVNVVFNNSRTGLADLEIAPGDDSPYVETNFGCVIKTDGLVGRFVRLYSNGCSQDVLNRYTEVETYGRQLRQ